MTKHTHIPIAPGGCLPFGVLKKVFAVVIAPASEQVQARISVRLDIGAYHALRIVSGDTSPSGLAECMRAMLDEAQTNRPQIALELVQAASGDAGDINEASQDDASQSDTHDPDAAG